MPFCRNCGAQLSENAVFCQNCGTSTREPSRPLRVSAGWGTRFVAWLIDIIIIEIFLAPTRLFWGLLGLLGFSLPIFPFPINWLPFVGFGLDNIVCFFYWTIMDGTFGQSIGKMAMQLKVTRLDGQSIDIGTAAIESLGKAFLLPLDCIIGWLIHSDRNQRLLNLISETMVVSVSH
jgi:uncharacterized RDD family membrane protein YckC